MKRERIIPIILYLVYIAVLAYLFFGHFDSGSNYPKAIMNIPFDKWVHFAMFFPYPIIGYFTFRCKNPGTTLLIVILSGLIMAMFLEMMQSVITTYRSTDIYDLIASIFGLILTSLGVSITLLFKNNKSK